MDRELHNGILHMPLRDREAQLFPTLTRRQLEFAARFASSPARRFEGGERVFDVGDRNMGVWLIAEGRIIATGKDGLGREQLFATCSPGQFSGEVVGRSSKFTKMHATLNKVN